MRGIVLEYLRSHRANGAEIAQALRLDRAEVYAAIVSLEAEDLIVCDKVRPRVYWRAA